MHQRKILLLENVASQAAGLRERLSQAGFQVAVSRYEADGLRRLAEWRPDIVVVSASHPAGDLVEYCSRARALAPAVRLVVTSPLDRERLFHEHPGLQLIINGVLPRNFGDDEVAALFAVGADEKAAARRFVVVLDRDPSLATLLRRALEPFGVQVAEVPLEAVGSFCDAHQPEVVVLEWPIPPDFIAGPLARIRERKGARELVLLLSDSSQESVSGAAPSLLETVDMFFRKPVIWEFFFRALSRHLELPGLAGFRPDAPVAAPSEAPDTDRMRADFQNQLEAKFLEAEELKRQLGAVGKKFSLALATEQLKRSELEVKLDNLLRMKEDFEFRAQTEIENRSQEIELLQRQILELHDLADGQGAERAQLHAQLESALAEKEGIEARCRVQAAEDQRQTAALKVRCERLRERLAAAERAASGAQTAQAAAAERLQETVARSQELLERAERAEQRGEQLQATCAELTAERVKRNELEVQLENLSRLQAQHDAVAGELERERQRSAAAARIADEEREQFAARFAAADADRQEAITRTQELLERAERRCEQLQADCAELEQRSRNCEAARVCVASEAEAAVAQIAERVTALEVELDRERAACADAERRGSDLRARIEEFERVEAGAKELRERSEGQARQLAEADNRVRELSAERDRLGVLLEARERELVGDARAWRGKAEAAALELDLVRAQGGERAGREEGERRELVDRAERAAQGLAERELQIAALREERTALGDAARRESQLLEARVAAAETATLEARERFQRAEAALEAERGESQTREHETRLRLAAQEALLRELEGKLAAAGPEAGASSGSAELQRIQELLEEVVGRARTDAVEHAHREAELAARLQSAIEERRLLQERFDRAHAEAAERERRSAALLQSAIVRGPTPEQERPNLPAIVQPDSVPAASTPAARRPPVLTGLAVVALAVVLAIMGLRRSDTTPRDPQPALPQPRPSAAPATPAVSPREVWDRWTRSDGSGGVLVQATLRSEQELRAEIEAEQRTRGWSAEEARAELARRLGSFRFGTAYYVTVYLKNLAPGYPAYLDDLAGHFRLRDNSGREAQAFLPPGQEKDRRIFSFGAGAPGELIYEATVPLGFLRAGLSASPGYIQLVVSDVGAASRRVLTWELE